MRSRSLHIYHLDILDHRHILIEINFLQLNDCSLWLSVYFKVNFIKNIIYWIYANCFSVARLRELNQRRYEAEY